MTGHENQEAAFIAKITASTTHEIRNVLAIIKESAGLIGDLVRASSEARPLNQDRIIRAVDRVDAQITRGADLLTNLNRFAHSLDHVTEQVDLNLEADQVAALCERFARQKGHTVEVEHGADGLTVELNALSLHMAFCSAVDCCLEGMDEPGTVRMRTGRAGEGVSIEFTGEIGDTTVPSPPTAATNWQTLEGLVQELGATVEPSSTDCRVKILLPDG